ncbi:hypothetical protein HanHA300_Chr16g0592951 [Helianthus annuus]|nr:hypothetical protein HanHA300_Chr16g0592951 [Helianthus annuus]KAJ0440831.1 hypothetical protein HanIR_Chr16g0791041 [Helianthus annuus]KAJ0458929.1 hypothetical protein HanHA89_Chr16g0643261 [Helianthus annuus]KAJ0639469.1 hypothetical protein HanLR1_Chr16g0604241 [Helianthus annuus]KAJ0643456.1 hypothetical protein HanOQP8_Chr16g0600751 [Helianthus annuus]
MKKFKTNCSDCSKNYKRSKIIIRDINIQPITSILYSLFIHIHLWIHKLLKDLPPSLLTNS